MSFFDILSLFGGLALFLFGMNNMGAGLSEFSKGRIEKLVGKLTANRLAAVFWGAAVTAVIQSSSAVTVIAVGLVDSGIMKLSRAVGVIMGANIGTTATAWILSLTGIESESFIIRLLKPSSFSPVFALAGIICILFCKTDRKKIAGNIFIGFAILMYGMEMMSAAAAALAEVKGFADMLTMFSEPVFGVVAGAVFTAAVQSSSASMGMLQSLCTAGTVNYYAAIPVIMGQNIGTCITAVISAAGACKNAKRAAAAHLYFNIIGAVIFMVIFYTLNIFMHFKFLYTPASPFGIALFHSIFNIACVVALFPFADKLEKLTVMTIPDK